MQGLTRRRSIEEAFGGPAVLFYDKHNPACAQVRTNQRFNIAFHDVVTGGMK